MVRGVIRWLLAAWLVLCAGCALAQSPHTIGPLQAQSNLADLDNAATARTNLGLGSVATVNLDNSASLFLNGLGQWAAPSASASAGGTSGQLQFNNAGALGGLTVSGDCTLNTTTGVMTCTATNGVAFGPLATAAVGGGLVASGGVVSLDTTFGNVWTVGQSFYAGADVAAGLTVAYSCGHGHCTGVTLTSPSVGSTFQLVLPNSAGSSGQMLGNASGAMQWVTVAGDGTLDGSTGNLVVTKTNGVPFAPSATIDTTNAGNITSGTLAPARLPYPTSRVIGGVASNDVMSASDGLVVWDSSSGTAKSETLPVCSAATQGMQVTIEDGYGDANTNAITIWATAGVTIYAQGLAASSLPMDVAWGSDTLQCVDLGGVFLWTLIAPAVLNPSGHARLPFPSATTLGGVESLAPTAHQFLTGISPVGVPEAAQPTAADISGLAASATTDTTNAGNISSGTLAIARTMGGSRQWVIDVPTGSTLSASTFLWYPQWNGTINSVTYQIGTGSFTLAVEINGTLVTGCSSVSVSSTPASSTCTAANTFTGSAGQVTEPVQIVVSSPTGAPTNGLIQLNITPSS